MLEKAGSSQNRTNPLITPKFTEYLQTLRVRLCFTTPSLIPSSFNLEQTKFHTSVCCTGLTFLCTFYTKPSEFS